MRQNMLKDRNLAENNTKLNNAKSIGSRNFKTNARGITLIALVITIIVLLILAGVSISAITGNDSAMEKAQLAKENSEKGDELDFVKLAVVDAVSKGDDGWVHGDKLATALTGSVLDATTDAIQLTKISNNANGPWIITGNTGMKYKVKPNGEVTSAEAVATVEFTQTEATIGIDRSKKLAITAKGASGSETEANEVKFTSSNTNVATVQEDGSIKIASNATEGATATITVEADGVAGSNQCVVTAMRPLAIGDYIEYNVAYTDMSKSTTYTSTTGWKILDAGMYNEGTQHYEGVKIISTGIPLKLYYYKGDANNNTWWDDNAGTSSQQAYRAAAGLANMTYFKNITLDGDGSDSAAGWNKGQKDTITNSDHTGVTNYSDLNCGIFLTTKASEVHNLTLTELNTAVNEIRKKKSGDEEYRNPETDTTEIPLSAGEVFYRLNSWVSYAKYSDELLMVGETGNIGSAYKANKGLRPVITLKSVTLKKNGSYWQVDPVQN